MSRALNRVAAIGIAILLTTAACGDGSSGGAEGEKDPGAKTEDTGSGY